MPYTYQPRTQKAKGLTAVGERFVTPNFTIVPIEKAAYHRNKMVGKFVRPCPMTPRHGFVDSRLITTREEATKIIAETKAQDSQAEFILSDLIEAQYNAIWTPDVLVVGEGRDGATGGKDSLTFPTIGDLTDSWLRETAGVKQSPFVEVVYDKGNKAFFTQLRDGPKVPSQMDYIPETMVVGNVVRAEGGLLEWETKVKEFPPLTVVYHPGGSLASHYAIHAVLHKIPVITSHEPRVGSLLEQVTEPARGVDLEEMRKGFYLGCVVRGVPEDTAAKVMLAACHHIALWQGKYDRLIGLGMGFGWRLTCTAALGENRHCRSLVVKGKVQLKRHEVYAQVYNNILGENRWRFFKAMYNFSHEKWGSSFGGMKWYRFSRIGLEMFNHFVRRDTVKAMETFNRLINAVHNTGWAFNKFLSPLDLDRCAKNPVSVAIEVAPIFHRAMRYPVVIPGNSYKGLPKVASVPRWFKEFESTIVFKEKALEKAAVEAEKIKQAAVAEETKHPIYSLAPLTIYKSAKVQAKPLGVENKGDTNYANFHLQWKKTAKAATYDKGDVSVPVPSDFLFEYKPSGKSFMVGSGTGYYPLSKVSTEQGSCWVLHDMVLATEKV